MKKILSILLLFIALFSVSGCKDRGELEEAVIRRTPVINVKLKKTDLSWVEENYRTTGTVKSVQETFISSRIVGNVTSLKAKEGDRVKKGQLLATIDDKALRQSLEAARAGYDEVLKRLKITEQTRTLTDSTLKRYKGLYDEKAISLHEFERIETDKKVSDAAYERDMAGLKRAEALLKEARISLEYARIKAPFSGVITEKNIEVGGVALPGRPLFKLEKEIYRVEAFINEDVAERLKAGVPAHVSIEAKGMNIGGRISEIIPASNPVSRSVLVKIDLKAGTGKRQLFSGLFARVSIPYGKRKALLVPYRAVVKKGQLTGVYVVDSSKVVSYRLVKTGQSFGSGVEVLSGLKAGENIIAGGVENAVDGGLLKVEALEE